ncbi:hypothetical protein [Streptomyces sp. NPDC088748]|uniref:hypothetical protein n=1 Tax=Streptomyces sp. NPDC088748 TaxID=3365887 RepID=UPI0037F6A4EB
MTRSHKTGNHSLAALKSIRAASPDAPIYMIVDNLSANKTPAIRTRAKNKVEPCLTPTNAS